MERDRPIAPAPVLERAAQSFVDTHRCPPASGPAAHPGLLNGPSAVPGADPDIEEEWLAVPGEDGERIRVRILRPAGSEGPLPVVLYLHGLGWMLTDATAHQSLLTDLVLGADAAVVIPDYDRPPKARYPVPLEQSYHVAHWIAEQGRDHRLDGSRIALTGVSGGANLAAALALLAKDRQGVEFLHQVLVCPVTDARMDTASYERFAEGYFLGRDAMHSYWHQYAPDSAERDRITASPLRAGRAQLTGLPPALVIVAEADVCRDEGEAYASALRDAGVPVASMRYHGTIHGFVLFDALRDSAASRAARIQVVDTLHTALHRFGP
ncbi:alpha/beta hydrolase [Streptomyces sp. NPDC002054]|uniref:alpha/beta hydrolase n=1 Tax=Streptomyces sp. NPDC002054 TaxID=3154663 RepID=UPI00331C64FF